jgi:DNA polymerase III subunit epsilon
MATKDESGPVADVGRLIGRVNHGMSRSANWSIDPRKDFCDPMLESDLTLAAMAEALERSTDYRVLRKLVPRSAFWPANGESAKTAVIMDVETTGLDTTKDEVIELAMVKFDYLPDGRITALRDTFASFNEPSGPIAEEVTALTGITDAMVAGNRIDAAAVDAFVADASIVIAHMAAFDRKFAERYWPIFEQKAWGCSATEVDWRKHGFAGAQLGYLLNGCGFFHQAHRAVDDCHALLEVLAFQLPTTGKPAFAALLEQARKPTMRVWAEQTPFDLKDSLKRRGYRWSDGSDGRPRSWYVDVEESRLENEISFLKTEIYLRDVELRTQILTATCRFSVRA